MQLNPNLDHWHDLGTALLRMNAYSDAVIAFRQALSRRPTASSRVGLGWSLVGVAGEEVRRGDPLPLAMVKEAEDLARASADDPSTKQSAIGILLKAEGLRKQAVR
jgi:hypothetical protein